MPPIDLNPTLQFKPAPINGGFRLQGHWVWCGSPLCDEKGIYHLFASRWPKSLSFNPHWLTQSEIVRAVAEKPEGPYHFAETVLPPRDQSHWDGRMTHNPAILRWRDQYLLFYTGTTYDGPEPRPEEQLSAEDMGAANSHEWIDPRVLQAHRNQRIGMAIAESLGGPWKRFDKPILEPREGKWDGLITTNPSPCVGPDDRIHLIYKSVDRLGGLMHLGLAAADSPEAPFERAIDTPLFDFDAQGQDVEDPFFWHDGHQFQLLAKDMEGALSGRPRAGVQLSSSDGLKWDARSVRPAYDRFITWEDGQTTEQSFLERPSLLFKNGKPTHFFAATAIGGDSVDRITDAWNLAIPLAED